MKKTIFLFTITLLLTLLATTPPTFAGKIYKWVDSEGKVHYGERPPSSKAKQMQIPRSAPSATNPAPTPVNKMDATNKFLETIATERKEKKEIADKAAKEKAINDKNCSLAKRRVASLKIGGRKFEVTEQGKRTYLDDAAIQSRLKTARENVTKWCK